MGFFDFLLGAKPEEKLPQIPTSQWSGYLAGLIASSIREARLKELKNTAAFVSKVNNGVGLCVGEDGGLPDFSDDSDTVAYCYLRDVPMFPKFYETMSKLLVLGSQSAKMLADTTGEDYGALVARELDQASNFPMIDQFAVQVAMHLEEKVGGP